MLKSRPGLLMIAAAGGLAPVAGASVPASALGWMCPEARADVRALSAGRGLRASAGFAISAVGRFAPSLAP